MFDNIFLVLKEVRVGFKCRLQCTTSIKLMQSKQYYTGFGQGTKLAPFSLNYEIYGVLSWEVALNG